MAVAVVDASALVALVLKESGHDTVLKIVQAGVVTPPTNMAEALHICRRAGHAQPADDLLTDLEALGVEVGPLTADDCLEIAYLLRCSDDLRAKTPRLGALSLGDATCIALARRLELPVVASDTTWELLDVGVKVLPFR